MLMEISVRDIHNGIIKKSDNGGLESVFYYMTQKVLIIDTTLWSFIPPQVRKMTPKLRQVCGCESCIIPKDMYIYLNIFRTRPVIYLQQKSVGRHTRATVYLLLQVMHITNKSVSIWQSFT